METTKGPALQVWAGQTAQKDEGEKRYGLMGVVELDRCGPSSGTWTSRLGHVGSKVVDESWGAVQRWVGRLCDDLRKVGRSSFDRLCA